ncbi:ferredoxin like protein [Comamonas testosteroni]|uniref:Ferredoxin like protein n=1 Tax=Comamonas testosteroni TaxID=285 RepID=Q9ZNP1_COMTE|nr:MULTISPECIES: 2Fe-2S iron-sulfur cluster binding domain-containing protein [Comamonas]BAA34175.1 ferredoxin like protein [Comamonas testosteroni]BDR10248.1 2Fe-2S iron-sulfur cluster binding domain-containing protein [Comamonas thiooxydans]GEQ77284.1 ferredoxin like protein [Comamonas testosteroni]
MPAMQNVQVSVEQTGDTYACGTHESLLSGMLRLGRKGIPVGCVNGGCGVCKVQVLEGAVRHLGPVSCAHVSDLERDQGYTLACRVAPLEAVRIAVAQRLHKPFFLRAASPAPTTHGTPTSN